MHYASLRSVRWLRAIPLLALATLAQGAVAEVETAPWAVKGTMAEACQCDVFCPCEFAEKPTHGHCDDTAILQIDQGHFGDVDLTGKRVVVVLQSPDGERLVDTVGRLNFARIFVPEGTSAAEGKALEAVAARVWAQFEGGDNWLSEDQKIITADLDIALADDGFSVRIPGILDLEARPAIGVDGEAPFVIHNMVPAGMTDVQVFRSEHYRYNFDGVEWDYAGRSASLRHFDLSGGS